MIIAMSGLWASVVTPSRQHVQRQATVRPPKVPIERSADLKRILQQNETICALLVLGLFTGGLATASVLTGATFITTVSVIEVQNATGLGSGAMFGFIAPHGFLEVLAFVIAGTAGFGGIPTLLLLSAGDKRAAYLQTFRSLGLGLVASLIVAIAAVVEAYVTPLMATGVP